LLIYTKQNFSEKITLKELTIFLTSNKKNYRIRVFLRDNRDTEVRSNDPLMGITQV